MSRPIPLSFYWSVGATLLGAGIGYWASGSVPAAIACLVSGLFASALLLDVWSQQPPRQTVPAAEATDPAPAETGDGIDAVLACLPDPVLVVVRGRIDRANAAALSLLGAHVMGEDIRLAIRHPALAAQLAGDLPPGRSSRIELTGIGAPDRGWELRIASVGPERHLLILSDQSARQAAERMRVDFVANASHELRTPLAGILGFIETLSDPDTGGDPATRDRFLAIMEREARRMQRLIDDLMSLSRIEADKFRLPEQTVDLIALTEQTAAEFHHGPGDRAADLVLDLSLACQPIRGDRAQLGQLIHNLVSNALKYGRAGTPVTVRVEPAGGSGVRLSVADEGEGIPPEHLPRLTERFYRVDNSRSRAIGGTGLGLAIVKHIVERHRGQLSIQSVQGQGTTVSILLPTI